ncbi:MAG: pyruvate, phosphate dikinase [Puniceicoccales bacterium]|jgi:pyruvate,orthophosphate dikinase|nr:pyruvate, phosphate dikinase [Puniceicoccales bacterium]
MEILKKVYEFGTHTDGDASMKALLGGKGANLAEMAKIGLPVPPGFTITTEICNRYYADGNTLHGGIWEEIKAAVKNLEKQQGKSFGDGENPLLVSVRSGARESMPGMMDTILNLGLNDETVIGQAGKGNDERFAYDCYRRFIQMYGDVVLGIKPKDEHSKDPFEEALEAAKEKANVHVDTELSAEALRELIATYKKIVLENTGEEFPQDVFDQLHGAICAVFESWNNERAIIYRRKYGIPSEYGTAVNVQCMVFGNMGNNCATGVAFTRNPATGEREFYGEYLINAQGEDVVAGIRTPNPIVNLRNDMPGVFDQLVNVCNTLESHFRDMQDFEFTIENGKLYMLQTRNGKRTGLAAIRTAIEMVEEGLIDKKTAIKRIPADSISTLLVPIFDSRSKERLRSVASGLPAGPGAASGNVYFSAKKAEEMHAKGEKVILCRIETSPEDIRGMLAAEGILTSRGGVSSHAALVARQMGKVCVCGAGKLGIDYAARKIFVGDSVIGEGDPVSIDGTTGEVFIGKLETAPSEINQVLQGSLSPEESYTYRIFSSIMEWADEFRRLGIRANADSPKQAKFALQLGAEGVGLCRTEHMFFEEDRIDHVRGMIIADATADREAALAKLEPLQRSDFEGIFREMRGHPVTIRLLDPPLHEFLPNETSAIESLSKKLHVDREKIKLRVSSLKEANPMLGHRGCRLGISYPEITRMQARAIFGAAANVIGSGIGVDLEIMIPLTAFPSELKNQTDVIRDVAKAVMEESGLSIEYKLGTMIEIPRACFCADEIAKEAQFFSFGTNDLTQTCLGMSRDDVSGFLPKYFELEILKKNPFASIDPVGVGSLIEMACERGRSERKDIKLGICGEHGGDPESIKLCHRYGLTYVSCSPNRVPVAKLAAAQAALESVVQGQ